MGIAIVCPKVEIKINIIGRKREIEILGEVGDGNNNLLLCIKYSKIVWREWLLLVM